MFKTDKEVVEFANNVTIYETADGYSDEASIAFTTLICQLGIPEVTEKTFRKLAGRVFFYSSAIGLRISYHLILQEMELAIGYRADFPALTDSEFLEQLQDLIESLD